MKRQFQPRVESAYNRQKFEIHNEASMNDEELTNLIIKELGKNHDHQAIVQKICEASTMNWSEAEKLIRDVESQNKRKIAARRGPFLIFVSIGTLVLGIGLLAYNIEVLMAIFNRDLLGQILSLQSGYYRILSLVTGAGMTIGGFYGVWTTLGSFFPD
jgi:hypothetical protein